MDGSEPVHREILIDAEPEQVFSAWVDPSEIPCWYVDHAEGDARVQSRVLWVIGRQALPLDVERCEPPRSLLLRNAGDAPWRGTTLEVELSESQGATRVAVAQNHFSEALRDHVPNVDAGWACMLSVLKEYVEHHAGQRLSKSDAKREGALDLDRVGEALSSAEAIERWSGVEVERLLASTPRGAVLSLRGFSGVFVLAAAGAATIRYLDWNGGDSRAASGQAEDLAERFFARVRALAA